MAGTDEIAGALEQGRKRFEEHTGMVIGAAALAAAVSIALGLPLVIFLAKSKWLQIASFPLQFIFSAWLGQAILLTCLAVAKDKDHPAGAWRLNGVTLRLGAYQLLRTALSMLILLPVVGAFIAKVGLLGVFALPFIPLMFWFNLRLLPLSYLVVQGDAQPFDHAWDATAGRAWLNLRLLLQAFGPGVLMMLLAMLCTATMHWLSFIGLLLAAAAMLGSAYFMLRGMVILAVWALWLTEKAPAGPPAAKAKATRKAASKPRPKKKAAAKLKPAAKKKASK